jgi:hypothetical protein
MTIFRRKFPPEPDFNTTSVSTEFEDFLVSEQIAREELSSVDKQVCKRFFNMFEKLTGYHQETSEI